MCILTKDIEPEVKRCLACNTVAASENKSGLCPVIGKSSCLVN